MRYVLATAAALVVVATLISAAFAAAPRLRTGASKTTQRKATGIYTRPSGRGHWVSSHATTSKTNTTVRRKR